MPTSPDAASLSFSRTLGHSCSPQAFKAANQPGGLPQPISPHAALLGGLPSSSQPPRDVEANAQRESVADRIEYTQRKKLLTLFYYGVCSYLVASICKCALHARLVDGQYNRDATHS
eukprot:scaffold10524_cov17-Tisochrysis_lutea.AAC.4